MELVAVVGRRPRVRPLRVRNVATGAVIVAPPGVVAMGEVLAAYPATRFARIDRMTVSPQLWRELAAEWERTRREAWAARVLAGLYGVTTEAMR